MHGKQSDAGNAAGWILAIFGGGFTFGVPFGMLTLMWLQAAGYV